MNLSPHRTAFVVNTVLLSVVLCVTSVMNAQVPNRRPNTPAPKQKQLNLDGEWNELSYEVEGEPRGEWERDLDTKTFIPVDIVWRLSSKSEPAFTRRVLRGDTEIITGDLMYGRHTLDTSVTPNQITFHGFSRNKPSIKITGIFKVHGDMLVIALPKTKLNRARNRYESRKVPSSFKTKKDSSGTTVYTLRRQKMDTLDNR